MKQTKGYLIFLLFFHLAIVQVRGQSRYLEGGIGGSSFQVNTVFSTENFVSAGLSAAYSIGGIMDIGFNINRETGSILTYERTDWNFNFLYNLIVIKQTEYVPISLQLEGSYGYTNISSDYLTEDKQWTQEAQGFEVGASLFREFNSKGIFSLLIGAKISYRNYLLIETNYDNPDPEIPPVINFTEREQRLIWGGISAITLKPDKWPYFTIEFEFFYNQSDGGFLLEPSFLITMPTL